GQVDMTRQALISLLIAAECLQRPRLVPDETDSRTFGTRQLVEPFGANELLVGLFGSATLEEEGPVALVHLAPEGQLLVSQRRQGLLEPALRRQVVTKCRVGSPDLPQRGADISSAVQGYEDVECFLQRAQPLLGLARQHQQPSLVGTRQRRAERVACSVEPGAAALIAAQRLVEPQSFDVDVA